MGKAAKFFDPLDLFGTRKRRAKKKAKKADREADRKAKRKARVLSDQAFRESSSLLGGRAGSTQTGTLLGG